METAIGIFTARERAEQALKELLEKRVPQDSIVYLTRSQDDAVALGKEIGSYAGGVAGGAVGLGAGMVAASMALIPGLGPVLALGVGAAALLGLIGKKAGATAGEKLAQDSTATPIDSKSAEDAQLFLNVLKEGRSLIVVRTDLPSVAKTATEVLDRLGVGGTAPGIAAPSAPKRMQTAIRQAGDGITVLALRGRVVLGEGNVILRETVQELISKGNKLIILNLQEVDYIDSAGIGELVRSHTTVRRAGGQLKLLSPAQKIKEMLHMGMLHKVFDMHNDEAGAIKSFSEPSQSAASA
jgi:anti-sigma B factor antagonist